MENIIRNDVVNGAKKAIMIEIPTAPHPPKPERNKLKN